jgi:uncharacterized coiled-coil DUF342 family protein
MKLYNLLTLKVGRETAEHLTTYLEDTVSLEFEKRSGTLATKDDLLLTKEALTKEMSGLHNEMSGLHNEMSGIHKEISRLDIKISENKSELIKWMFTFWIAQVAATFGLILLFLKK